MKAGGGVLLVWRGKFEGRVEEGGGGGRVGVGDYVSAVNVSVCTT